MDIEERAEKWARDNYGPDQLARYAEAFQRWLVYAFLAGVAQAQADEAEHRRRLGDD